MAAPCIVPAMHVATGTGRVVAGRYYLQDPIGRGAMGTVWRARDTLLARDVAVKEVVLRGASTPEDRRVRYERTLREARTAARLNHPSVVTVFDVVEADGSPWIVMELVQARSLERILAEDGPLPPHQAAEVGVRLLGALATAHAAGILHRDVKPSNVLLGTDGRAVLTDFGIATREGDSTLTQVGMVMGTPGFTAPERIRGEPATPASDLWSLGATLYAAVDGHGPFEHRGSSLAVLSMIANEDAPRPRAAGALGPAIDALLQRDPGARPDASAAGRLLAAAVTPPADHRSPGGGHLGGAFQGDAFPGSGPGIVPADSTVLREGSPHGSRPTVPQPPAADLPTWMSFPPVESPPEGVGPAAESAAAGPVDVPTPGRPADVPADASTGTGLPGRGAAFLRQAGHSPGRHGAQAAGDRRWLLAGLGAVAIVCAGVLGGLAIGHPARSSLPAGYHWFTAPGGETGTAAGFTMAAPNGWPVSTHGLITDVADPVRHRSIQVDLAPFEAGTAFAEASFLAEQAVTDGSFPGYRRVALRSFIIHGSLGAAWEFTWHEPGVGRIGVLDILFKEHAQAGWQAYRIQVSARAADQATSRAILAEALRTFDPH
jgi:tRNA A-37 threonylcarbamoyl transferase component Bud32